MKFAHVLPVVAILAIGHPAAAQTAPDAQVAPVTAVIDPPIERAPPVPAAPANGNLTMPKWSEFPVPPKNVPTLGDIAAEVKAQTDRRQALDSEVAALTWDGDVAETFKAQTVARLDPEAYRPIDPALSTPEIEAFAAGLRRRAVPPPVAH